VERSDTASMIEPARYAARATTFDGIVSATDGHYWDPSDPRDIDFGRRFPIEEELVPPPEFTPELSASAVDGMDEHTRIRFGNELTRFHLSQHCTANRAACCSAPTSA
jgi:hypothetical protein